MKRGCFISLLLLSVSSLFCQDTISLNRGHYAVITKESGKNVRLDIFTREGVYKGWEYYSAYDTSKKVKNGEARYFYPDGKDSLTCLYEDNRLTGKSVLHYPSGSKKLEEHFKKGVRDGALKQYYPDGSLRRDEVYNHGEFSKGRFFDEAGNERQAEPYWQPARFPGGVIALHELLTAAIRYPEDARKNEIEGRVILNFMIDKEGKMISPKIVQGTHASLDKEAIRALEVVAYLHEWEPAKVDGEPVRTRYTIPLVFEVPTQRGL